MKGLQNSSPLINNDLMDLPSIKILQIYIHIRNKDRPLSIVYKAVLTIFMLYVYGQNIDIILKRRQVKKAMTKIVTKQAK